MHVPKTKQKSVLLACVIITNTHGARSKAIMKRSEMTKLEKHICTKNWLAWDHSLVTWLKMLQARAQRHNVCGNGHQQLKFCVGLVLFTWSVFILYCGTNISENMNLNYWLDVQLAFGKMSFTDLSENLSGTFLNTYLHFIYLY